jgi:malate dehydrogenase (oxaloacetate-decarboxylating)
LPVTRFNLARVVATGRGDYPNQINNALAFPGIFRGAPGVEAREITEAMQLAVAASIARATREAAWTSGVARRPPPGEA